jgi:biopolymer transport protein ExbD
MTRIPSPRSARRARIEIIPLIDIIFFLLATFMMVSLSMVKNLGIPVNLPSAATATAQDRSEAATISISASGELFLNKAPVDEAGLDAELQRMARIPETRVFINGDADAEFGRAVDVLDRARKAGVTKLAIQTQPAQP